MLAQPARQKWFLVTNPDAVLRRRQALSLIGRHADRVRVFEDLGGHPALMIKARNTPRLVLLADLSDEQINMELQAAWQREHDQADLFRDVLPEVANDDVFWSRSQSLLLSLKRLLHTLAFDR